MSSIYDIMIVKRSRIEQLQDLYSPRVDVLVGNHCHPTKIYMHGSTQGVIRFINDESVTLILDWVTIEVEVRHLNPKRNISSIET